MLSTILEGVGLTLVIVAGSLGSLAVGSVAFVVLYVAHQAGKAGR